MNIISRNSQPNLPSHRVYAVRKKGERSYWREIGAAWSHKDGEGFSVKLDYLPMNGAEIVIRTPRAEDTAGTIGAELDVPFVSLD